MFHRLSDDGFRRFSLARPQTARMMPKLRGDPLAAVTQNRSSAHTYLCKNPAPSLLPPRTSIVPYGKPSDASAGVRSDGIPNIFASFCLLSRLRRSVKEFRRLSGVVRCHSGLLFLQELQEKMYTLKLSQQLKILLQMISHLRAEGCENSRSALRGGVRFTVTTFDNAASLSRRSLVAAACFTQTPQRAKTRAKMSFSIPCQLRYRHFFSRKSSN